MNEYTLLLLTYLVASIPFGLVIGKVWGAIDVRKVGSGNIGTSNVLRSVGWAPAVVVLLLDVLKGGLPVWFALDQAYAPWAVAATAFVAVFGHCAPIFLKFRGGKGIATAFGAAIALNGWVAISLVVVWVAVLIAFRYISLASVVAALWFPIGMWVSTQNSAYTVGTVLVSAIAVWRHRSNIQRLLAGTEYRFGQRAQEAKRHP